MDNDEQRDFAEEDYWRDYCAECGVVSPDCRIRGHFAVHPETETN